MAAPEAPLRRLPGSKIIGAAGKERSRGVREPGGGWRVSFLSGVAGRGGGGMAKRGSQAYLGPRAPAAPGDMMIDRCDVGSHVVSESVEGGWLMPGT
jgi:hypothetical protein